MNTLTRTKSVIAGLSALTLLGITACSDEVEAADDTETDAAVDETQSAEEPDEAEETDQADESGFVFDFSPMAEMGTSDELRIQLPEELVEMSEKYQEHGVLEAVTVRAAEDSESQCAIEFDFEYADGGAELIEDEELWDTYVEASGWWTENSFATVEDRLEHVGQPGSRSATNELESSIADIQCASSAFDSENTATVSFRYFDEDPPRDLHYSFETLASVELNIMASGDIHVTSSEVEGYHFSGEEHGWLSNDQTVDSQGNVIDA